ncbi:hypothetical protein [Olivibacter jilunii]|uniref:hypothetical protein n=1 Tax=Olivibacter jilunii TaxID=985016 RepID=UPI0010308B99|nr:hypothetical protein [Olivibacter jilunii]
MESDKHETKTYRAGNTREKSKRMGPGIQARRTRVKNGKLADRPRGPREKKQMCTTGQPADAFLKHRFLPMVENKEQLQHWQSRENSFFQSLAYLAEEFGFTPMGRGNNVYPLNVYDAFCHAKSFLLEKHPKYSLDIIEQEEQPGICHIAMYYQYLPKYHFNWIPLHPLYSLAKKRKRPGETALLFSIMAYLKQIVHMADYDNDYIGGTYAYMEESYFENGMEPDSPEMQKINEINTIGKSLLAYISRPDHLHYWKVRLDSFRPVDDFGKAVSKVAQMAYRLYNRYPGRSIMDNLHPDLIYDQKNYCIQLDECVSFIWDGDGWLFEEMEEYISCYHNESTAQVNPTYVRVFDRHRPVAADDLRFEKRFFNLLEKLANIIYSIP